MKITIKGDDKVYDTISHIADYQSSPIFRRRLNNSNRNMRRFWKKNIYNVFNRRLRYERLPVSGNLGRAMTINSRDRSHVILGSKKLSRSKSGISGGPCKDYVGIIMKGSKKGRGIYSRRADKKIKINSGFYTPGVSRKYGIKWRQDLSKKALEEYRLAIVKTFKEMEK